ncbi:MAG: immune inhibitor A, partial [Acidimicrobiia bacterium]|nr:immune inhibitor A [Acidimicrobiia bacterium]
LRLNYSINGGRTVSKAISEWAGGERYGDDGNIWFAEYRGDVTGQSVGDSVEVWFTAVDTPSGGGNQKATKIESERFTYDVVYTGGAEVLVLADNSPGTALGGGAPLEYVEYYTDALDANGVTYTTLGVDDEVAPHPMGVLNHFDGIIWYTGEKLVTDYQGGLNTTFFAHEMNMNIRDFINEGGKVLATGKNHGFQEFFPLNYGENADPTQVCASGNCRVMTDDVYQYWFGAFSRSRRGGLAPDGTSNDVAGLAGAFEGLTFALDGGDSANNQGATDAGLGTGTASFVLTDSILPNEDYPAIAASERLARWDSGGTGAPFEPVTGDWQVASGHDDVSYKRLTTTVDVPAGAASASLDFKTSYSIETDWDYLLVEAHTVGGDDWTTLPDANGHTATDTGQSCLSGWADQLHPWLYRYQDVACNPTGTTGSWNAATGPSAGIEDWSIDLSAYAGSSVEVSIAYVTDWATGDLGVFLDDVSVNIDGVETQATSFEAGLDFFTVPGAPEGSVANPNDWERVGIVFEIASVVGTDDTLLFGFGFEGISTEAERNEVMARSLQHLGLG